MKILFLGDYSGLHACMARELRRRGHSVTLLSDGGRYMQTECDIMIERKPGKLNGLKYFTQILSVLHYCKGFDVVHLNNPHFVDLRPQRIKIIFDYIRKHNRLVLLTLCSNDYHFCNTCLNSDMFKFSEFRVGDQKTEYELTSRQAELWTTQELRDFNSYIYSQIDGAISILPEYDMAERAIFSDRLAFVNLPIDLTTLPFSPFQYDGKLRFFVGMKRDKLIQKGTRDMLAALQRLESQYPDRCEVEEIYNLPLEEYLNRMQRAHVVVDQLYSYSPATNALQAMALGRIAASGGMPEYYQYIDRDADNSIIYSIDPEPVVRLSPLEDYEATFRDLILNPYQLKAKSLAGRLLVEQHNDSAIVAERMERHWEYLLSLQK